MNLIPWDPALVLAYLIGGLTFYPTLFVIAYLTHKILAFCRSSSRLRRYETTPTGQHVTTFRTPTTIYKVGWLRVSRHEQRLPAPDASIGGMVKSYIAGSRNSNNNHHSDYFAVLKNTTLFLYDSEKQLDCKDVIQVNQHRVSIHPPGLKDHELFTRPQLIKLEHPQQQPPYYVNCDRCIDKEDWYFALLYASQEVAREQPTDFDQAAMNQLITTCHSNEHHFQTQWFNAILGRIFCAVYKTDEIRAHLYHKLISKLDKINARRPPFLEEITVRSVDPGQGVPFVTQPRLLGLSPSGELTAEAYMQYAGGIRFEIETVLIWKYLDHVPPLKINIVLAVTLKALEGKAFMKIKEPPSNRIWYGFYEKPRMDWLIEPVVWERRVGYSMVVRAIKAKMDELVMENMVLPNLDDITFFPTNGAGGIFGQPSPPSTQEEKKQSTTTTTTTTAQEKYSSMPDLFATTTCEKPKMRRWFSSTKEHTTITEKQSLSEKRSFIGTILNRSSKAPPVPTFTVSLSTSPTSIDSSLASCSSSSSSSSDESTLSVPHNNTPPTTVSDNDDDQQSISFLSVQTSSSTRRRLRKSASWTRPASKSEASTAVSQINVSPVLHHIHSSSSKHWIAQNSATCC